MAYPYLFLKPKRFGYLVDAEYIGKRGVVTLQFLDPKTQSLFRWYDKTGHLSYLLTDAPPDVAEGLLDHDHEFLSCTTVVKYDAIIDRDVTLTKVFAQTPLAIGGESPRDRDRNFRDILLGAGYNVWEAWIRYHNRFRYDNGFEIGMPYVITNDGVKPYKEDIYEHRIEETLLDLENKGVKRTTALEHWVRLFEYDLPKARLLAVDIEVLPEGPDTLPNPVIADQPIIAISLFGSDGRKDVYVLRRPGVKMGRGRVPGRIKFFESEREMEIEALKVIMKYPIVITFNGDNFDMMFLYNRGKRLGIPPTFNPIYITRKTCKLTTGVHIDLYPFMKNPSIQNYAFSGKYKPPYNLDNISTSLLGRGKIKSDIPFSERSYVDLATYCLNDADLTYELCTFGGGIMINLIFALSRMSNLTLYEITRQRIGEWVKSTFFYLLVQRGWLIPTKEELASKGEIQTEAKIKGKKYQGAIVHEPVPGVKFLVVVMDFQSLYPTEVKERNVGFSTINCGHPECTLNKVPDTTHYICIRNRAIEADVIGGLRDVRVHIYKPLSSDKSNPLKDFHYTLQQAIKVYINAAYGVFGNDGFGLYCPPVAEAITAFSRRDMKAVIDKAEEMGIIVLGGDTDSVFLWKPTKEETEAIQKWATDELKLDLGIDKVYRYAIFSSRKKNYFGVYEDGRVDITGLSGKKSHIPDIIKGPFFKVTEILSKINNMEEYEDSKSEIRKVILDLQNKIAFREWDDIKDMAFHMRLGRRLSSYTSNPQHVKAARILEEMGFVIGEGDIIHFVKSTTPDGVMPVRLAKSEHVNVDTYLEQVQSVFDQIVEPMGINIEVVRTDDGLQREVKLIEFMK